MNEDKFILVIEVDKDTTKYEATGKMTSGSVKMMVAELELIKLRLLSDYEKSIDNNEPSGRFEFN